MNFLTFLQESRSGNTNIAHIMIQKITDMVDTGHVDYTNKKMTINLGKLVKDSSFYNLNIVVRKAAEASVKLGKNRMDDKIALIIDTTYYPRRQNLAKLFHREEVVNGFEKEFTRYLKTYHDNTEVEPATEHENSKIVNAKKGFEGGYKDLEAKMKEATTDYQAAKKELESKLGGSALASHKARYESAIEHLKKETIGTSAKEFISKMMKLADKKYVDHLDADSKKKLQARLTSYYEHHFA